MVDPGVVTAIVLVVVAAGSAPIFGVLLWNARHRVSAAAQDVRAGKRAGRARFALQLLTYGFVAAVFTSVGASSLLHGHYLIASFLIVLGIAYGLALYSGLHRSTKQTGSSWHTPDDLGGGH